MISGNRGIDGKYDVFISHANKDKLNFIDELYNSLDNLGINIFYDKKSLEWGDKWKRNSFFSFLFLPFFSSSLGKEKWENGNGMERGRG